MSRSPLPLFTVDAFTDRAFSGNPAAVCLLPSPREASWMQLVAREMNLSETAFLVPRDPHDAGELDLRWFTPTMEVDLCGHATLASAHVLWEAGRIDPRTPVRFHTRSGVLGAIRTAERIVLDFPAHPAKEAPMPGGLEAALGARAAWVGRSRSEVLVELESEEEVRALAPDFAALARVDARACIVTARARLGGHDFVSRFFAPAQGIPEDPVTGSAHCVLGPYWSGRLEKKELTGYQASARGGTVRVTLSGDRVSLGGQAVTVARGELLADQ